MTVAPVRVCIINISQHMTKPTKWHVRPAKTDQPWHPPGLIRVRRQCPHEVSAWRSIGSLVILRAHSKVSDQTGVDAQADLSHSLDARSFCCAAAHKILLDSTSMARSVFYNHNASFKDSLVGILSVSLCRLHTCDTCTRVPILFQVTAQNYHCEATVLTNKYH